MAPLNNFTLQYLCHDQFVFCFRKWKHYIEKHLIANSTQLHSFINTSCITALFNIGMFLQNGTKSREIINLYSSKSFLFIVQTFAVGVKTKNLQRATRFGLWSFYKGVYKDDHLFKTTTFELSQKCSSDTGLTVFKSRKTIVTFHGTSQRA